MATSGKPITQSTIQELAAAIATAINQSGGNSGRSYNPISNQASKQADPGERVAQIRSYKTAQDAARLTRELVAIQNSNNRSMHDLQRMLEFNRKTLSRAIDKYDNFTDAQDALVMELKNQLSGASSDVKALAGNIEKLEDVFAFSDAAKAATDLANAIKSSTESGQNVEEVITSLDALKKALPNGKTLADVDGSLDSLDKRLQAFLTAQNGKLIDGKYKFHDNAGNERTANEQARINKALLAFVRTGAVAQKANKAAEELSVRSNATVTQSSSRVLQKFNTVVHEAESRVRDFAVRAGSAAFVLDKLADAAKHLYATVKQAAATGTQRSFSEIIGREFRSVVNGVSVEAVNKAQTDHARQRRAGGTENYDQAMYDGKSDFFRLTGDLDEALTQAANTMDIIGTTGASLKVARVATKNLTETFNELTMLTGMTVGEINAMNKEMTDNYTFRQSLNGLDEKSRAESVRNLDLMMKENVLRGISIQQSKDMQKAQQDMANPWSPRARLKNAALMRVLGGAQGINTESAAQFIQSGGPDKYKKKLMDQGMSAQAADAEVERARQQFRNVGTANSEKLGRNDADSFMTEALGQKMGPLASLFDGRHDEASAKPQAVVGKAAEEFKEGSKDFLAGVALFTGGWAANFAKSVVGTILIGLTGGLAANLLLKKFGGVSLVGAIPALAGGIKAALPGLLGGLKNLVNPTTTIQTIKSIGPAVMGGITSLVAAAKAGRMAGAPAVPGGPRVPGVPTPAGVPPIAGVPPGPAPITARPGTKAERRAIKRAERRAAEAAARAGAAGVPGPSGVPGAPAAVPSGRLAKVGNFLKGGLGLSILGLGADLAGDSLQQNGYEKTGAASKVLGSAASGAGMGAMLGSFVPVIGTGIGAAVGGTIGAGMGLYNNFGSLTGSAPTVQNPGQPTVSRPGVNTASDASTASSAEAMKKDSLKPNQDTAEDRIIKSSNLLANSVKEMNTTLGSILGILKDSKELFADKHDISIEMQKRLQRLAKNNSGILGDPTPASQAYNV
jgi:hypothetical protein